MSLAAAPSPSPLASSVRATASIGQASLWFLRQVMPCKTPYTTGVQFRLVGELDARALTRGFDEIVRRHESLRTTFTLDEGTVVQVIAGSASTDVVQVDLSASPDPEAAAQRLAHDVAAAPFDLARGPLLRVRIVRVAPREHLLIVVMDHIIADGLSLDIMWRELGILYRAFRSGDPSPLEPPHQQYAAWVTAHQAWMQTPAFARQLAYWKEHLAGAVACPLPEDRPRPPIKSYRGGFASAPIPGALLESTRALAARENVSLFASLLATLDVLLARYSGQRDIVVMIPVACRQRFGTSDVIGFFSNMVVTRTEVPDELAFREVLGRVNAEIMSGLVRQDVPFEKVIEAVRPDRSLSHDPVARIALSFLPAGGAKLDLPGVQATFSELPNGGAKFDLHITITEHADHLGCIAEYNSDVFDASTIEQLLGHYRLLLEAGAAQPACTVGDLPMVVGDERRRIVEQWNQTRAAFPREASLPALVSARAAHAPDSPAASFEGKEITYRELCRRSNQVARCLRARGVGPGVLVGIAVDRSLAMLVGLLGILQAGGGYVPLDPAYPRDRLAFMAADSGLKVLLTEERFADLVEAPPGGLLRMDSDGDEIAAQSDESLGLAIDPESLAYVIYTSGSTGRPKGVEIPHRAVVNFLTTMAERPGLGPADRLLAVTSLSFDIAGLELWLPLVVGAHVEIASRATAGDGAALKQILDSGRITVMQATPSTFRLLIEAGWQGTAGLAVLIGGEATPGELADKLLDRAASVWNMYGPTETTIWSCIQPLAKNETVLIGRPIANTRTYVLDAHREPVPPGVAGELYLGGDGIAHGYLGRPELTAERFVPDPFVGGRMYRTGDSCRFRRDGALEFLGRLDHQLKIRGYRIELGEIETVLAEHPDVLRAVVIASNDAHGEPRLVAYVVGRDGGAGVATSTLRSHLEAKLPEYMVPAAFVVLDSIPLQPNGKIDRKALPAPGDERAEEATFVAPRTPQEEVLAGIWADVLGAPRVSVEDDFFALGGHSLLGMRVLSRVSAAFGVELPMRTLFEARTVAQLAERLTRARESARQPPAPPLLRATRSAAPPLSFAQQRLWFLDQLESKSAVYNIPQAVRLTGALDTSALQRSLAEIVRRHEALRTSFASTDGEPRQVIGDGTSFALTQVDLTSLPEESRAAEAQRLADEEAQRPFDLATGPLFRAVLLTLADHEHVLVLGMHHIISDGWSEGVLVRELSALYGAFSTGQPSPLAELPIQTADYALWQRAWLEGDTLDTQLAYWKEKLSGAPAALELPADRPRPAVQSYQGTTHPLVLPPELVAALTAFARREGATLFMTLLAAFQVLLARYSGQDDVVVGSPIAGRTRAETEGLIGFFVNTLVLRTDVGNDPTVRELLARVRETTLDAYAHQDVPFERLVGALSPPRDLSRTPLFQVMLILQNAQPGNLALGDVRAQRMDLERGTSKFDLTLWLEETPQGLSGFLEYPTALFDAATIARMAEHLQVLLRGIAGDPARRLSALPMLTADEHRRVVQQWNDTQAPFPREVSLVDLVDAAAEGAGEKPAVTFEGQQVSYRELCRRSRQVARCLRARGVGPGVLVGIAADRSIAMLVSLLGILRAGGAYVPLDPAYPTDRLAFMAADSGLQVLVTEARYADLVETPPGGLLLLDSDAAEIVGQNDEPLDLPLDPESLAYVIYTSGSTGKPKGVQIPHRAIINFLTTMAERPGLDASDRLLAITSLSFDIAGLELWLPLTVGAHVEIASRETASSGSALKTILDSGEISVMQATPSTFRLLLDAGWEGSPRLKVLIGGEAVPRDLAERLVERAASVWNMYGPTETTVWSTIQPLQRNAPVLIGRPIANTQTYVLDRTRTPVPVGVTGELYIGGAGVALGYLGRPELTAERFVPDPFSAPSTRGARLYRTGDLCRHRPDGALEFLGRVDFQVKIRGHRIELGEIETTLATHAAVREVVVVAYEETHGDPHLVAYLTAKRDASDASDASNAPPTSSELREHLRATLPDYMIPTWFMVLDQLPLTANNKIDRKALPAPTATFTAASEDDRPREALEFKLRAIWEEVLGIKGIGVRDSFFDLGGHSLLAVKLFDRMDRALAIKLPLASLIQAPTIGQLAELLRRKGWEPSWSSLVPIQTSGKRPPFFCVHAVGGNVLNYRLLSKYLGEHQPFYGLQSRGLGGNEPPHASVEDMARSYVKEMVSVQPKGPYLIGGASSGGVIAFEMAQQLRAAGERMALLVMFDTTRVGLPGRTETARAISPLHGVGIRFDRHFGNLLLRTPRKCVDYVADRVRARFEGTAAPIEKTMKEATDNVRHVFESNVRALSNYVPRPYSGEAVMLLSRDDHRRVFYDERLAWADLIEGGLTVRFIPGDHENLLDEPQVGGVAAALGRCLDWVGRHADSTTGET